MLIAVDLQNDYWNPKGKYYVPATRDIVKDIAARLDKAAESDELLICIRNVYDDEEREERGQAEIEWAEAIYAPFADALKDAVMVEKVHYGLAPEEALRIKEKYEDIEDAFKEIEFVGVETNVCVLANVNIVQNIFTESALVVNKKRTAASNDRLYDCALEILSGLKVKIEE